LLGLWRHCCVRQSSPQARTAEWYLAPSFIAFDNLTTFAVRCGWRCWASIVAASESDTRQLRMALSCSAALSTDVARFLAAQSVATVLDDWLRYYWSSEVVEAAKRALSWVMTMSACRGPDLADRHRLALDEDRVHGSQELRGAVHGERRALHFVSALSTLCW